MLSFFVFHYIAVIPEILELYTVVHSTAMSATIRNFSIKSTPSLHCIVLYVCHDYHQKTCPTTFQLFMTISAEFMPRVHAKQVS